MLTGLHLLLTYQCLYECDHCFLYCGPRAEGTFTSDELVAALHQAVDAGVTSVYVEGGEPFLFYPVMLETLRVAKRLGLSRGVVTNAYWATSKADARLWLAPLAEIGLDDLSVSDDAFHSATPSSSLAGNAVAAAEELGLPVQRICIDSSPLTADSEQVQGAPKTGGEVVLKGRAVATLASEAPQRHFSCFSECTQEELVNPGRVHLDPFGNVFVCQGLSLGNIWQRPLAAMMVQYRPQEHPIIGPLVRGGPAELARVYGLPEGDAYASDCHLCFLVRRSCVDRFPGYLCPASVYGLMP